MNVLHIVVTYDVWCPFAARRLFLTMSKTNIFAHTSAQAHILLYRLKTNYVANGDNSRPIYEKADSHERIMDLPTFCYVKLVEYFGKTMYVFRT